LALGGPAHPDPSPDAYGASDREDPSASRPSSQTAAPRPAYGLLWLQIDPDNVSIALDGQYLDKDVWLVSVPPGEHVLSVSKAGYASQNSRFGISAGQNVRLDLKLLPE